MEARGKNQPACRVGEQAKKQNGKKAKGTAKGGGEAKSLIDVQARK